MTTAASASPSAASPAPPSSSAVRTLVDELLLEQRQLTAVERFSQRHENAAEPLQARHYRDLIPLSRPGEGEQYGFEVDLEACSGCKACVTACHSLNGLDETESWRDVGALVGGGNGSTAQQTVTTACHHCADPACAEGCPTLAYEKDPETGVVRHLDDQCMGCRYCELKCPYEVPKYNERLGIVRKCDMCHGRLAEGEAPACVQACPNEAIRIRTIPLEEIDARSGEGERLLPGTVTSDYTRPATRYLNLHENAAPVPADADRLAPAHGHFPLAWMLALTQLGAGLVAGEWAMRLFAGAERDFAPLAIGVAVAFAGLAGSILHLGRPTQAWRAFLGWRKSWLSREIIVFGPWAGTMAAFAGAVWLEWPGWIAMVTGAGATVTGLSGVFCSAMVYADTRRPAWRLSLTAARFFAAVASAAFVLSPIPWVGALCRLPVLAWDVAVAGGRVKEFERMGRLARGPLRGVTGIRIAGDVIAVAAMVAGPHWSLVALGGLAASELAARSLFFRAVEEPKMPGGIAS